MKDDLSSSLPVEILRIIVGVIAIIAIWFALKIGKWIPTIRKLLP